MKVNIQGDLIDHDLAKLHFTNRGLHYGDAVFETVRIQNNRILFWEDHYFRLMGSMRIVRMQIPISFTLENLEKEILELTAANQLACARVKFFVFRKAGGLYTPDHLGISYFIESRPLPNSEYQIDDTDYVATLFKDHFVAASLLSNLKTNNRVIHVLAGIFAKENGFHTALLCNTSKQLIEANQGNIFMAKAGKIYTPPLGDGCLKGIFRKQVLRCIRAHNTLEIVEQSISPFALENADELFITNVVQGVIPITHYKRKTYTTRIAKEVLGAIQADIN